MPAADVVLVGLHHVQRPRLAALAADVHQHERAVAAQHLVGEVEAAAAEVEHGYLRRQLAPFEGLRHGRAEPVVLEPGVADSGDQDPRCRPRHLGVCGL